MCCLFSLRRIKAEWRPCGCDCVPQQNDYLNKVERMSNCTWLNCLRFIEWQQLIWTLKPTQYEHNTNLEEGKVAATLWNSFHATLQNPSTRLFQRTTFSAQISSDFQYVHTQKREMEIHRLNGALNTLVNGIQLPWVVWQPTFRANIISILINTKRWEKFKI